VFCYVMVIGKELAKLLLWQRKTLGVESTWKSATTPRKRRMSLSTIRAERLVLMRVNDRGFWLA
jgi:hypothetical protein